MSASLPSRPTTKLGLVALSVLLGRRITPDDYPNNLNNLLDEFTETAGRRSPTLTAPLREWLEEALDPAAGFETALAAGESLSVLGHPGERIAIGAPPILEQLQVAPVQAIATPEPQVTDMALSSSLDSTDSLAPQSSVWMDAPAARKFSIVRNAAIGLAVVALVEGAVISQLMARSDAKPAAGAEVPLTIESPAPGDRVIVDGRDVGVTPLKLPVGSNIHSIRVIARAVTIPTPVPVTIPAPAGDQKTAAALTAAAQRQRPGGIRVSTPIELQVLEGEKVLGSSGDGPIVASAGVHQLDFINTAIGFRSRQTVTIKAGEIIPMRVQPPDGRVSINAQPWAQVWIDGNLVGETPLANLPVAAGEHEITFRHPQLGERRETAMVKSGVQTRISATLAK
jgi:PEGA domain-containing protein